MCGNDPIASIHNHAHQLLTSHEALLGDEQRNLPFYAALQKQVYRGCHVLDIGSGTGVWAIAAARLGASRVVAIERDPLLVGLIQALARENGVADRIEVVAGDSRQVQLDREFDVVISETIGHIVFDEQVVPIMIDARERFLKPGGALIPAALTLRAAPAYLGTWDRRLPAGLPIVLGLFESLLLHAPVAVNDRKRIETIAAPADLIRVDLGRITTAPDVSGLTARWTAQDARRIDCFAVWVEATLATDIEISTMDATSWGVTAYRIRPFHAARGDVEFKLTLTNETHSWTASLTSEQAQEMRAYSPAQAATALLAASRVGPDGFRLVCGAGGEGFGQATQNNRE